MSEIINYETRDCKYIETRIAHDSRKSTRKADGNVWEEGATDESNS